MKKYATPLLLIFTLSCIQSIAQDVFNLWEGEQKPYYKENTLKESEKEEGGGGGGEEEGGGGEEERPQCHYR